MIESIRSAIVQECEDNMNAERLKWAKDLEELREEHQQALVEVSSREKIRDTAEQQVRLAVGSSTVDTLVNNHQYSLNHGLAFSGDVQ